MIVNTKSGKKPFGFISDHINPLIYGYPVLHKRFWRTKGFGYKLGGFTPSHSYAHNGYALSKNYCFTLSCDSQPVQTKNVMDTLWSDNEDYPTITPVNMVIKSFVQPYQRKV